MRDRRMWLALTSFLLSLAPLVAIGLVRVVALGAPSLPGTLVTVLSVAVYAGGFVGSVGAVVTGRLVLRGTQQQPPFQPAAGRAAAVAGIMIGIAGMVLLVIGGVILGLFLHSCVSTPATCG